MGNSFEFLQMSSSHMWPNKLKKSKSGTHTWAPGGEPSSEDRNKQAVSEFAHPEEGEYDRRLDKSDWSTRRYPSWTEPTEDTIISTS